MYLFIFAIVFLIVKAFVFDNYIERYTSKETNTMAESNESTQAAHSEIEPKNTMEEETNKSTPPKEKNDSSKMLDSPLERLGDKLSKHINL